MGAIISIKLYKYNKKQTKSADKDKDKWFYGALYLLRSYSARTEKNFYFRWRIISLLFVYPLRNS